MKRSNFSCGRAPKLLLCLLFLLVWPGTLRAEEHTVERGETALQIAIDYDLTMDQLSLLNPDKDLEMMRVGEILIVPDKGQSFDEFLNRRYSERLRIEDLQCSIAADQSAVCLFHAENISDLPLQDVRLQARVSGTNGTEGTAEAGIALMQILPGEKLPVYIRVPGNFSEVGTASVTARQLSYSEMLQTSFRVAEDQFSQTDVISPDGIGAVSTILFNETGAEALKGKKINLLAVAYDEEGALAGVRSLYSDFYPRLDISVYSVGPVIRTVKIFMEAY